MPRRPGAATLIARARYSPYRMITAMRLAFLVVVFLAVLAGLGGFVYLGLHPPPAHRQLVDHKLDPGHFPAE